MKHPFVDYLRLLRAKSKSVFHSVSNCAHSHLHMKAIRFQLSIVLRNICHLSPLFAKWFPIFFIFFIHCLSYEVCAASFPRSPYPRSASLQLVSYMQIFFSDFFFIFNFPLSRCFLLHCSCRAEFELRHIYFLLGCCVFFICSWSFVTVTSFCHICKCDVQMVSFGMDAGYLSMWLKSDENWK